MIWRPHRYYGIVSLFFQNEERKVVSGNTKGNNNILLPLQLQLAGQMCFKISRSAALFAAIVYYFNS